jgi:ParB family chromosome partitioning protein
MRAYWRPSADNYFSRVSKAMIVEAVREGVSTEAADRLLSLKKPEMAQAAEQLMTTTGWLPIALRSAPAAADQSAATE